MTLRSEGSGPHTIVFVHGFPLDATLWDKQRVLAAQARLITFDLPGFGAAAAQAAPQTIAGFADRVRAALDAQGVDRAVLCGLSMGGYIVFECWRRFPERIAGIVLADTRAEADPEEGKRNRDAAIAQIEAGQREAFCAGMLEKLLAPASRADPALLAAARGMMARASQQGLVAALATMRDRPDSTDTLGTVNVPTLIAVGGADQLTPPPLAQAMARGIAGAKLVEIPGAGHLAPLEKPQAFNEAFVAWLAAL